VKGLQPFAISLEDGPFKSSIDYIIYANMAQLINNLSRNMAIK